MRQTFKTKKEARNWEIKVLKRMKVVKSDRWLNKTDRKGPSHFGMPHSEKTKEVISQKKKECFPPNKGIPSSIETREKLRKAKER